MLQSEDLLFFHRNGYLIMRGLIHGAELQALQADSSRLVAEGRAHLGVDHLYRPTFGGDAPVDQGDVYWRSENMLERDPSYRAVVANPDLLTHVAQCAGHAVYPWNASLVVKIPDIGTAVPWHQDPPYMGPGLNLTHPHPNFTCDIYLDHSDEGNGCVYALPGRHLSGHQPMAGDQEQFFSDPVATPLRMEPGDVLLHWVSTPHGSRKNSSPRLRRTLYIHFLSEPAFQESYNHPSMPWAQAMGGWSPKRRQVLQSCLTARRNLGWGDGIADGQLSWSEHGIEPSQWQENVKIAKRGSQIAAGG